MSSDETFSHLKRSIEEHGLLYNGGDKLLFTSTLADLATKKVITASEEISIQEAAELMTLHDISSLVLVDPDGLPSGIITDRDLRKRVVAKGRDIFGRVGDIMSISIIKSEADDYCFEALLKMIRYNIHHLLIISKGELKGILTSHDLMSLQGTAPLAIAREIETQDTVDGLAPVSKKINKILLTLIKEEAKAGNITRIITEINDRLLQRLLQIARERLGPPPVEYCWIVYGSEGRKEQTFRTDQDNGIVFFGEENVNSRGEKYFSLLSDWMKDALARCGFPPCSAGYMAGNPRWRQPLGIWERYFAGWINNPSPEAVLQSIILFDFRPVYGDFSLGGKLRAFLGRELRGKKLFFLQLAAAALRNRPPLNFLGKVRGRRKGADKGKIDIKINGLSPIIDAARLAALEYGIYSTSTLERLKELHNTDSMIKEYAGELEQAFQFLMSVRLRHQYRQLENGLPPDNLIDPNTAGDLEKNRLKDVFKLILAVQDLILRRYNPPL